MKSKRSRKDRTMRKCKFRAKLPASDSIFKIGFPLPEPVVIKRKERLSVYGNNSFLGMIYIKIKRISESSYTTEEKSAAYKLLLDEFKRQNGL